MAGSIREHFADLPDPRVRRGQRHSLASLLTIAICAVICGADSWTEVEQFGRAKEKWFQTFLDLPYGIPSHDTFGRVFAALNPEAFDRCFRSWTKTLAAHTGGTLIAVGLSVWSVMTALSGLARSFPQLAAARVGVGVGEASASPARKPMRGTRPPRLHKQNRRVQSVEWIG